MNLSYKLDQLHASYRANLWHWFFAIFCRIVLAAGFIPSGMVKILGERFTALSVAHPMGNYLEALHHTGYYYTFIGIAQVTAAILLLISRTAVLGAFIYFPIILNICILSLAVRFDGSLMTSPLMVLADLYLLFWYYHKWKGILPFNKSTEAVQVPGRKELSKRLPIRFFAGSFLAVSAVVLFAIFGYGIYPRNSLKECEAQCSSTKDPEACMDFCNCIHEEGSSLQHCLKAYREP